MLSALFTRSEMTNKVREPTLSGQIVLRPSPF